MPLTAAENRAAVISFLKQRRLDPDEVFLNAGELTETPVVEVEARFRVLDRLAANADRVVEETNAMLQQEMRVILVPSHISEARIHRLWARGVESYAIRAYPKVLGYPSDPVDSVFDSYERMGLHVKQVANRAPEIIPIPTVNLRNTLNILDGQGLDSQRIANQDARVFVVGDAFVLGRISLVKSASRTAVADINSNASLLTSSVVKFNKDLRDIVKRQTSASYVPSSEDINDHPFLTDLIADGLDYQAVLKAAPAVARWADQKWIDHVAIYESQFLDPISTLNAAPLSVVCSKTKLEQRLFTLEFFNLNRDQVLAFNPNLLEADATYLVLMGTILQRGEAWAPQRDLINNGRTSTVLKQSVEPLLYALGTDREGFAFKVPYATEDMVALGWGSAATQKSIVTKMLGTPGHSADQDFVQNVGPAALLYKNFSHGRTLTVRDIVNATMTFNAEASISL